ncbi:MAG: hypothetical protein HY291_12155 [Planctomycetes bacterium]|nr:hypothetical protein [Planctomycetota bacterium]
MASLACALLVSVSNVRAEDEQGARSKFAQEYNQKRWKERLTALDQLKDVKEDTSFQLLWHVSVYDPDPEVRLKSFRLLAACPDKLGYVAYLCANSLTVERNMSVKFNKAASMSGLRYKYYATEAIVDFLRRLRLRNYDWYYIDTSSTALTADGRRAGTPKSWDGYNEPDYWNNERDGMRMLVTALNRLSNAKLQVRDRVDQEVVEWWNKNKDYINEDDQKVRAKESPPNTLDFSKLKLAKADLVPAEDPLQKGLEKALADKEEVKLGPAKKDDAAPPAREPAKTKAGAVSDEE